jgi:hypothetical protein
MAQHRRQHAHRDQQDERGRRQQGALEAEGPNQADVIEKPGPHPHRLSTASDAIERP